MLMMKTTQEHFDENLTDLETKLGQTAPIQDPAFLRVLAALLARRDKPFDYFAAERIKQNLILTANKTSLKIFGKELDVPIKAAKQAEMTATISTTVDVPALTTFISDSMMELYRTTVLASPTGGVATLNLKAVLAGADYTLAVDDTLTIQSPIAGCGSTATVTAITVEGLDEEETEAYRRRLLTEARTVGGGGNNADFRTWAEAVDGVVHAFPYSGCSDNHNRLVDGDMEDETTDAWTIGGTGTLSKETTDPAEGTRYLRVTKTAAAAMYAYQEILGLTTYAKYNITGYARGDGTSNPKLLAGTKTIWTGTTSTSWQSFDVDFEHDTASSKLRLETNGGAATNYTEWDGILLRQESQPGDATVIIECSTDLDADGIPDQTLLDSVYDAILEDPVTGIHRPTLGTLDALIHVEPISRTEIDLEIRGLNVPAAVEAQAKSEISDSVDAYLRLIVPFIQGLDSEYSNNSLLTDLTLSQYIQDILTTYGGSADGIGISVSPGEFVSSYQVGMGETLKKGTITYV